MGDEAALNSRSPFSLLALPLVFCFFVPLYFLNLFKKYHMVLFSQTKVITHGKILQMKFVV